MEKQTTAKSTKKSTTTKKKTVSKTKVEKSEKVVITKKPSVLFVASEANPFAGTGGLADVIGSLPKSIKANGEFDVRVVIPLYKDFSTLYRDKLNFLGNFNVELSWRNQYCGVFTYTYENVIFYFIDNEYYFKRTGLYGFYDDGERFAFFSKAVLTMMQFLDYYPNVLHAHDWQSALSVVYLKTVYKDLCGYDKIKAFFTIHNIEYQGKFGGECLGDLFGLDDSFYNIVEYAGCINLMKGAIVCADKVSTVSPSYAEEIKYDFYSHGLSSIVQTFAFKTLGILNGIDESVYNPSTDNCLFENYGVDDLSGKKTCKRELQKMLGLPEKEDVPVVAVISRLVAHKGLDLLKGIIHELLSENVQLVILGKGERQYEEFFSFISDEYKGKCRTIIAYNKDLSSKIYSGADIFLMPSKQEPCGLSQMISAKYGAVPVVRKTGGLGDSISPFNKTRDGGNGFVFENYNAHEMLYVLKDAMYTYQDKETWSKIIKSAMSTDFTWKTSAEKYQIIYKELL